MGRSAETKHPSSASFPRSTGLDDESARRWFVFLLLCVALLYAPLMLADYAWDDEGLVLARQAAIESTESASLHGDLWMSAGDEAQTSGYYRPAFLWTLDVDQALWPGNPGAAHMQSLAWHLAAVLALFLLLVQLVPTAPALVGVALFAFHPAQSEAVAWISARNDLMVAALGLGAVAALMPQRLSVGRVALGTVLMLGALLSKESAVAIPVLLVGIGWVRGRHSLARGRLTAIAVALCGYVALRASAGFPLPETILPDLGEATRVAVHYLALLGFPRPLSVGRTLPELVVPLQSILFAGVVCGGALWAVRRGGRLAAVALGFGALAFVPVLGSIGVYGQLGDRFLYLPLAGISLAVAAGLPRVIGARPAALALVSVGLIGSLAVSERLPDWRNSEHLWEAEVESVDTTYAHANLANVLHRLGRAPEAREHYLRSLEGPVKRLDRCGDAIRSALELGDLRLGLELVERAYAADCPRTARREGVRALLLLGLGRLREAGEVAEANPSDPSGRTQLIRALTAERAERLDEVEAIANDYLAKGVPRAAFDAMLATLRQSVPLSPE